MSEANTTSSQGESSLRRVESRPAIDVFENDTELFVKANMPGVHKETLSLDLEDGILTVEGTWLREFEGEPLDKELTQFVYKRTMRVPNGTDEEAITAKLSDGVLYLQLPWVEKQKARQIVVN